MRTRFAVALVGVALSVLAGCGASAPKVDATSSTTRQQVADVADETVAKTTTSTEASTTTTSTTTTTLAPPTTTTPPTTAPPPPPTTTPPPPPTTRPQTSSGCDPNYSGCVPISSDVDCAGGSGNGPAYVQGPVQVTGSDIYGLDADHDGTGCE